jgi:hypothetical protein
VDDLVGGVAGAAPDLFERERGEERESVLREAS